MAMPEDSAARTSARRAGTRRVVAYACPVLYDKAAKTLADAAPWGAVAGKTEHAFPIAILGLFGTGAYMTSDIWTWSTGWIDVSIAGLALLALQGPLVGGRTGKQLKQALQDNGPARWESRHDG